jgi:coenzyme A diphosphatase NUDT7
VTPVVALLSDLSALNELKPGEGEVSEIFDHPLEAILDPTLAKNEPLVPRGSEHWPYDAEYQVRYMSRLFNCDNSFQQYTSDIVVPMFGNATYRMHRFRSMASPVKGLTSDILVRNLCQCLTLSLTPSQD